MCGCVRVLCVWVFVGECLAGRRQSLQCEESPSPAPALRTGETGCAYVWVCACVVCVRVCVCVCVPVPVRVGQNILFKLEGH